MLRNRTDFLDIFFGVRSNCGRECVKKTGLLIVCSDPAQKKIDRADALNIPIISEQQWYELMSELEAVGMWNGKQILFADNDGIYRVEVGGES